MALKAVEDLPAGKKRITISLRVLLVFGFGGLVALSVGGVLAMSVYANFTNTHSLLDRQAELTISGMEQTFADDAKEAERMVQTVGRLHEQGAFEMGEQASQEPVFKPLLMSGEVIENIVVITTEGRMSGLIRSPERKIFAAKAPKGRRAGPPRDLFPKAGQTKWMPPLVRDGLIFHNVAHALTRNGKVVGMVSAAVGPYSLNRIVGTISSESKARTFVLNEQYQMIAHSSFSELFRKNASVPIEEIPDDATRVIAAEIRRLGLRDNQNPDSFRIRSDGGASRNEYVVMTKPVAAMSEQPYVLAAFLDAANLGTELHRARVAALFGASALAIALAIAIFFSTRLTRPLTRVADTASRFADLDLEPHKPLSGSRIREIDGQMRAMNAMHTALKQFGQYVPKELVRRLLHSGTEATRSVEREITVMFTDVAGFTAMSENMSAGDVVSMLNAHFETLCGQISANRGTVDKFMGDGLMAFWGAPDADEDHAGHAIEAARAIADVFKAENAGRRANGQTPLRLRIGIHTGRAVVGNIGASDRHNYTIVGDVVNVASRLEQLGKELIADEDVCVVVSGETLKAAKEPQGLQPAGSHMLRGRQKPITVFVLATEQTGKAGKSGSVSAIRA